MSGNVDVENQEQLAFDTMDDLLERATWKKGLVVLKTPRTVYFCYDITKLRAALTELANAAVLTKYNKCVAVLKPVVENIIDEYAEELKEFRVFERRIPKRIYKKAQ